MHVAVFLVQRPLSKHGEWNHDCSLANDGRGNEQPQSVRAELFDPAADLSEKLFFSVRAVNSAMRDANLA
jgi:hypothetical protein